MAKLAIGLTIAGELKTVQRKEAIVLLDLQVELAWAGFGNAENARCGREGVSRPVDRPAWPQRAKTHVDQKAALFAVDQGDAVGQTRVGGLVVDDPAQRQAHREPQFRQNVVNQSVVLEAVAAAPLHHDALVQGRHVQGQVVSQPRSHTGEGKLRHMTTGNLGQQRQIGRLPLQAQGMEVVVCDGGCIRSKSCHARMAKCGIGGFTSRSAALSSVLVALWKARSIKTSRVSK